MVLVFYGLAKKTFGLRKYKLFSGIYRKKMLYVYKPHEENRGLIACARSVDPDQPVCSCSMIRIFIVFLRRISVGSDI